MSYWNDAALIKSCIQSAQYTIGVAAVININRTPLPPTTTPYDLSTVASPIPSVIASPDRKEIRTLESAYCLTLCKTTFQTGDEQPHAMSRARGDFISCSFHHQNVTPLLRLSLVGIVSSLSLKHIGRKKNSARNK